MYRVYSMCPSMPHKYKQIAFAPRTEDYFGCKRCESACPTDFLSIGNRWTFPRTYFTDGLYHKFSYFSGLASYSKLPIILFPNVSNFGVSVYNGSNEPILNLKILANRSSPVALEILFYIGFLIAFSVKSPIIPLHIHGYQTPMERPIIVLVYF
ncbi:hypothetical protein ACOSP7_018166 [Xanthoceras sorbifolium]